MTHRALLMASGIVLLGFAIFLLATQPRPAPQADLNGLTPDATHGALVFAAAGCANPAKRGALWGKVQQVVYDEVPFIEVGKFNGLSARSAKLQGYTPAIWPFFWNTGLAK